MFVIFETNGSCYIDCVILQYRYISRQPWGFCRIISWPKQEEFENPQATDGRAWGLHTKLGGEDELTGLGETYFTVNSDPDKLHTGHSYTVGSRWGGCGTVRHGFGPIHLGMFGVQGAVPL